MFIAINRIVTPADQAQGLIDRFSASNGLAGQPGVLGFELLRRTWLGQAHGESAEPEQDLEEFLVTTRWESEADFQAWLQSDAFKRAHAQKPAAEGRSDDSPSASPKVSRSQASGYEVVLQKNPQAQGVEA
jgi:heme-degrading monooxygenase HmoA